MVSLEERLGDIDQRERVFRALLSRYVAVISGIARQAVESSHELMDSYGARLNGLREKVLAAPAGARPPENPEALQEALADCSRKAVAFVHEQQEGMRRALTTLREAAHSLEVSSEFGPSHCQDPHRPPDPSGYVDNLGATDRSSDDILQLKAIVDAMWHDSQVTVRQLRSELQLFQRRLEHAEALAATDPLTGLANRREAERIIAERIRARQGFCIMLFDLNHFKSVNDRYGHHAGDQVLRAFSRRLVEQYPSQDVVCRWGGDEFLAVVSHDLDDAASRARQVIEHVRGCYVVKTAGRELNVHIVASVGVAEHRVGEGSEALFSRADELLYQDKVTENVE